MVDLNALKARLESRALDLLPQWLPGGKLRGKYFEASDVRGGDGDSLKYDVNKHKWMDYANRESMGDIIDLYAQSQGINLKEAMKILAEQENFTDVPQRHLPKPAVSEPEFKIVKPPAGNSGPQITADHIYEYRDVDGSLNFVIARIDATETQGKRILQFGYDFITGTWIGKSFPKPRPLFGLEELANGKPICIVEGEKSCLAARTILGDSYTVMTWAGGSAAAGHADWSTIAGRRVLIWPDADAPGAKCSALIAETLAPHNVEIKILTVDDMPKGWDAADAVQDGMTWTSWKEWAKPRVTVYTIPEPTGEIIPPADLKIPVESIPTQEQITQQVSGKVMPGTMTVTDYAFKLNLSTDIRTKPFVNIDNAVRALSNFAPTHDLFWYDDFHQRILKKSDKPDGRPTPWTDGDTLRLTQLMQAEACMGQFGDELWFKAVTARAMTVRKNEVTEWIKSLKWDGVQRLSSFFEDALGVDRTAYSQAVSRNFWRSMVARAVNPGCKVDTMVILEGKQGAKKSTALSEIAGPAWHTESTESITTKDFYLCLQGKLLVEIAELDSFGKNESTKIKQVISNCNDTYRTPYGRVAEDHPRQCVFAGTTNEKHYLRDATGGRRFWPLRVGEVSLDAIRDMREQCFAEAYSEILGGCTWWDMPVEETLKEQVDRQTVDIWEDMIYGVVRHREEAPLYPDEIYTDMLGIPVDRRDRQTQMRVTAIMAKLGWENIVKWNALEKRSERVWMKI